MATVAATKSTTTLVLVIFSPLWTTQGPRPVDTELVRVTLGALFYSLG